MLFHDHSHGHGHSHGPGDLEEGADVDHVHAGEHDHDHDHVHADGQNNVSGPVSIKSMKLTTCGLSRLVVPSHTLPIRVAAGPSIVNVVATVDMLTRQTSRFTPLV